MNNIILNNISVVLLVGFAVFVLVTVFLEFQILKTNRRIQRIFRGVNKENIEELLGKQLELSEKMKRDIDKLFQDAEAVRGVAVKSIHKVGVVRFNPFQDTGGDQSFVIAFLDAADNGLVVSSLHSREGTRVYMKPIEEGMSEKYKLTKEEEEAINRAKKL